jgi:large subunit ribosomal protein L21
MLSGSEAAGASVAGRIVAQGRGPKVRVMKFKKTNQYKIFTGHRQNFTAVEVSEIKL